MVALLDVNLLVALFDGAHVCHEAAHVWFAQNRANGWASCPLTENGLVRIVSNPRYPGRRAAIAVVLDRLRSFRNSGHHTFWPDSVSLCEEELFRVAHIQGHRQLTDIYLLALAVKNGGSLATLDRSITRLPVAGAGPENLILVPSGLGDELSSV